MQWLFSILTFIWVQFINAMALLHINLKKYKTIKGVKVIKNVIDKCWQNASQIMTSL